MEQNPRFHCAKCGRGWAVAKAYRAQVADLTGKDVAAATAESEQERP